MEIRAVIGTLILLVCTFFSGVSAHEPKHGENNTVYVYILETIDVSVITDASKIYQESLQALMPEHEIVFTVDNAQGSQAEAEAMLIRRLAPDSPYELVVSIATIATRAMVNTAHMHNKPMQFMLVADPMSIGATNAIGEASSLNISGISHVVDSRTKLQLFSNLAKNSKKNIVRIGLVYSDYPSSIRSAESLLAQQEQFSNIQFVPLKYEFTQTGDNKQQYRDEIAALLTQQQDNIDGYWIPPGPAAHDQVTYDFLQQQTAIPQLFSEDINNVRKGALFGVLANAEIIGSSAAELSYKVLNAGRADQFPIIQVPEFIVPINITTAVNNGFIFPSSMLALANNHLYR